MSERSLDSLPKRQYFTTSEARKAGFTKDDLKSSNGCVNLGSFPVRLNKNGNRAILENLWTFDQELFEMVKKVKKLGKKVDRNPEEIHALASQIESKIRIILFGEEKEGEQNDEQ